jgi:SAM-dependent methyltransferase
MREEAYNNRDHVQLLRCGHCGFVYSKEVSIDYNTYGRKVSELSDQELADKSRDQGISELVTEVIDKSGITGGSVLDFGCGIGLTALEFRNRSFDVLGIEESEFYREMLNKRGVESVSGMDEIRERQNTFDLVIAKDVIEHVEDPLGALQGLSAFIKHGGYLYIRVPNRFTYPLHWAVDTRGHINHFTPSMLMNLLEHAGLVVQDFISIYDISTPAGRLYNSVFWKLRGLLPLYHQVSLLCQKPVDFTTRNTIS